MDPSSSTPVVGPVPPLDNTLGAWLIGTFIGLLLQGVAYHQTSRYFCLYPHDPRYLKLWVVLITLVETVNAVLSMHTCYYYLVTNYFSATPLLAPVWSLKFLPVPGAAATVITQFFFARRIYRIDTRFRPIAVFAGSLVVAAAGCYIAMTGVGWYAPNTEKFVQHSLLPSVGAGMLLIGDGLLTSTLIIFLRRNRTGVTRTDSMLDTIVMYTVSSGLIICIANTLTLTFTIAFPDDLIYAAMSLVLAKLYSNSFLVSLNARQSLINRGVIMEGSSQFGLSFKLSVVRQTPGPEISLGLRRFQVPLERVEQHLHVSNHARLDSAAMEMKVVPEDHVANGSVDSMATLERRERGPTDAADIA
ncbi:hypothetical protein C8T65DRAFT_739826 [Cerioporus squamosus]|nr:hypothetical protein C8T65DRAFT_739826 [Cerioporus squamosus]